MTKYTAIVACICLTFIASVTVHAQERKRTELTKGDLTGTNMEIVVGTVEMPPGASGVLHSHPGEEVYYVIDGATALLPDGREINFEPGIAKINIRDVPHGAFKVIGDKTLKLLTVHVVDKGKPMTVLVK